MNIYYDNYLFGVVVYFKVEWCKVRLILEVGYNVVCSVYNLFFSVFLQVVDELGLLVISEVFDVWNICKWDNRNDYLLVFKCDWQCDLIDFVVCDINYFSIIMWSLGNEIFE